MSDQALTDVTWLLDPLAQPLDGAWEALMEHAPGPAASLPVDPRGRPREDLVGRFIEDDIEGLLTGVRQRAVPLRHIGLLSLLVTREHVRELDPPDHDRYGPYAVNEWTARLFARHPAVLVPASRVCVADVRQSSLRGAVRFARQGVWMKGEVVRELSRAASDGLGIGR